MKKINQVLQYPDITIPTPTFVHPSHFRRLLPISDDDWYSIIFVITSEGKLTYTELNKIDLDELLGLFLWTKNRLEEQEKQAAKERQKAQIEAEKRSKNVSSNDSNTSNRTSRLKHIRSGRSTTVRRR